MYAPFFGLNKEPFSIAPDPRFLFMSEQHREALAHLLYGLSSGGGFVLLTGEVGAGKTTVCRCFLEQVPAQVAVAYIFNPKLTVPELLQTICGEFGLPLPRDSTSVKAHVDALNAHLLALHAQGRQAVLVIDEAQSLSAEVLEQLRLLTNLETAERKLLQIVLIGQPELRQMLAQPGLEQLAQRVIARYHLGALTAAETQQYIRHRLAVAGPSAPLPFEPAALARIHRESGGVPRRINLLADRALLGAYGQGARSVGPRTVVQAAREVFSGSEKRKRRGPQAVVFAAGALAVVGVLGLVGAAGWTWFAARTSGPHPALAQATPAPASTVSNASPTPAAPATAATAATPGLATADGAAPSVSGTARVPASAPIPTPDDIQAVLAAATREPQTAWRELALHWNVAIGEGEPCAAAAQAKLACFRSTERSAGLTLVRQLARPVVLPLRAADGGTRYAVLTAVDDKQAQLAAGGKRFVVSLPALAGVWRGEFSTLWRTPPSGADADNPATRAWADTQLAAAGYPGPRPLRERVAAYQLASGLPLDGVPGPLTLMSLNRLGSGSGGVGGDEPRLGDIR